MQIKDVMTPGGGEELYDEAADPLEYTNLASDPEYAVRKSELAKWLPKTDAANLPGAGGGAKRRRGTAK